MSAELLVADNRKFYALPMRTRWLLIACIIVWGLAPVVAAAIVLLIPKNAYPFQFVPVIALAIAESDL